MRGEEGKAIVPITVSSFHKTLVDALSCMHMICDLANPVCVYIWLSFYICQASFPNKHFCNAEYPCVANREKHLKVRRLTMR